MNKMYLVLGDWSCDGHGKYDKILLESSVDVEQIQNAYKDSCRITDVEFDHSGNYTELNRDWRERGNYQVCVDFNSDKLPESAFEALSKFGLTKKMLAEWDTDLMNEDDDECYTFSHNSYIKMWIWFVKLSLPKNTVLRELSEKDSIPVINGYWNKNLNVQFGYGLYH